MSSTKRNPLPGILLLLPIALVSGCACTPPKEEKFPPSLHPERAFVSLKNEQIVCVTLVNGVPTANPDPVTLSKEKGHVAHWFLCGLGQLAIKMKKEDPFPDAFEDAGNHVRSGRVDPKAEYGKYPYSITVILDGKVYTTPDPEVDVER